MTNCRKYDHERTSLHSRFTAMEFADVGISCCLNACNTTTKYLRLFFRRRPSKMRMDVKQAYKSPMKNLTTIIASILKQSTNSVEEINVPAMEISKIFLRPVVSAKNPQICKLIIVPINPIDVNNPCCVGVPFISQRMYGKAKPIFVFSIRAVIKQQPQTANSNVWYLPWPMNTIELCN